MDRIIPFVAACIFAITTMGYGSLSAQEMSAPNNDLMKKDRTTQENRSPIASEARLTDSAKSTPQMIVNQEPQIRNFNYDIAAQIFYSNTKIPDAQLIEPQKDSLIGADGKTHDYKVLMPQEALVKNYGYNIEIQVVYPNTN